MNQSLTAWDDGRDGAPGGRGERNGRARAADSLLTDAADRLPWTTTDA